MKTIKKWVDFKSNENNKQEDKKSKNTNDLNIVSTEINTKEDLQNFLKIGDTDDNFAKIVSEISKENGKNEEDIIKGLMDDAKYI